MKADTLEADLQVIRKMFRPNSVVRIYESLADELIAIRDHCKGVSAFSFGSYKDIECSRLIEQANSFGLKVIIKPHTIKPHKGNQSSVAADLVYVCDDSSSWRVDALSILLQGAELFSTSDSTSYIQSRLLGYTDEQARAWVSSRTQSKPVLYFLLTADDCDAITTYHGRCLRLPNSSARVFYPMDRFSSFVFCNDIELPSTTFGRLSVVGGSVDKVFAGMPFDRDFLLAYCNPARLELIEKNMTSSMELFLNGKWERLSTL